MQKKQSETLIVIAFIFLLCVSGQGPAQSQPLPSISQSMNGNTTDSVRSSAASDGYSKISMLWAHRSNSGFDHFPMFFFPDGKTLATGYNAIQLWDTATPRLKWTSSEYAASSSFWTLAVSPDGTMIAVGRSLGIDIWDVPTLKLTRSFEIPAGRSNDTIVQSIAFSSDSRTIAAVSSGRDSEEKRTKAEFNWWNLQTGALNSLLEWWEDPYDGPVWRGDSEVAVGFSPDQKSVVMGSRAAAFNTLMFWDLKRNSVTSEVRCINGIVNSVIFSPDGRTLAVACGTEVVLLNVSVRLFDAPHVTLKKVLEQGMEVGTIAFSPDGITLAVGCKTATGLSELRLLDTQKWEIDIKQVLSNQNGRVVAIAFSSDGSKLAVKTSSESYTEMSLWSISGPSQETNLPTGKGSSSIIGYIDIIEVSRTGCRIRFISGDRSYIGIVSFESLSALIGRRIRNYEEALTFFEGKLVNVSLSGLANSNNCNSSCSFSGISRLTVVPQTTTIKTQQRWSERTTATETIIDLSTDILFDFNKSTINPNAVPALIKLARLLRQSKGNAAVRLNGFTDSIGTNEYNIGLSQRRSAAVKQWLVSKGGVNGERLATNGFGKAQPIAPNTNPDGSDNPNGRQKNRRVEIRIPK